MFKKEQLSMLEMRPRKIAIGVNYRAYFCEPTSILAFGFLIIGLVAMVAICLTFNFANIPFLFEKHQTVPGVISSIQNTGVTQGGSRQSKGTPLYRINYTYRPVLNDQSTDSNDIVLGDLYKQGEKINVEYLTAYPTLSRIEGNFKLSQLMPFLVIIFPIIGLIFLISTIRQGINYLKFLKDGQFTYGELGSKAETGVYMNRGRNGSGGTPEYKLGFAFKDLDGQLQKAYIKSFKLASLEDDKLEPLLYDMQNPSRIMLLDDFPGDIGFNGKGEIDLVK